MRFLTDTQREILHLVARRVVPESAQLDDSARARFETLVDDALALREPREIRMLGLFLHVLAWAPVMIHARPLNRLDPAAQDAALRWFQDAPLPLIRKGFWGVKALVFMGYYGLPEVALSIGYRPSRTGNASLAS